MNEVNNIYLCIFKIPPVFSHIYACSYSRPYIMTTTWDIKNYQFYHADPTKKKEVSIYNPLKFSNQFCNIRSLSI